MNSIQFLASTVDKALNVRHPIEPMELGKQGPSKPTKPPSTNAPIKTSPQEIQQQLIDLAVTATSTDSSVVSREDEASIHLQHKRNDSMNLESDYSEVIDDFSVFGFLLKVVLFLPNNLIFKPTVLILRILTFPARLLYRILFISSVEEDIDGGLSINSYKTSTYGVHVPTDNNTIDGATTDEDDNNPLLQEKQDQFANSTSTCSSSSTLTDNQDDRRSSTNTIPTIVEEDFEFEVSDKADDLIKSPTQDLATTTLSSPSISTTPLLKRSYIMSRSGSGSSAHGFNKISPLSPLKSVSPPTSPPLNPTVSGSNTPTPDSKRKQSQQQRSRNKRFVFPTLLFSFDIFNPPQIPMKTLVLDLDETLIHSLCRQNSSILTQNKGVTLEIKVNNNSLPTLYRIYKRPYVDEFLNIVKEWFNLVCFTASIKEYADPVLDYLEEEKCLPFRGGQGIR
ncbi:unnamed protein product [Ambrosiozyma monospora]|uniref:Mitochondrial import inner membrane translocase subunit TIM50 n=1 Tax=Ambrosiozyma monospora TaxID=43982 RepID=A0A9W6Z6F1_AMBMO|nr:unnamed protein product [Ambrosiozyma monospora]